MRKLYLLLLLLILLIPLHAFAQTAGVDMKGIDALLPPVLQPYKQWFALAFFAITYVIRPALPAPKANSPTIYVFIFNVIDRLSGSYGYASHVPENIPAQNQPQPPAAH